MHALGSLHDRAHCRALCEDERREALLFCAIMGRPVSAQPVQATSMSQLQPCGSSCPHNARPP